MLALARKSGWLQCLPQIELDQRTAGLSLATPRTDAPARRGKICAIQEPRFYASVKLSCLVLVCAVAAPRNNLAFAEGVGLADGIAAILAADAEEVGGVKAPMLIGGADNRGQAAVFKVGQGHFCRLGVDGLGRDADHGAAGLKDNEAAPEEIELENTEFSKGSCNVSLPTIKGR